MKRYHSHLFPLVAVAIGLAAASAPFLLPLVLQTSALLLNLLTSGVDPIGAAALLTLANAPVAVPEIRTFVEQLAEGFKSFKAEQREQVERLEKQFNRYRFGVGGNDEGKFGGASVPKEERTAFNQYLRTGDLASLSAIQGKAVTTIANSGGYAVPTWIDSAVASVVTDAAPVVSMVTRRTVPSFPARELISTGGATWGVVGETGARPTTASPLLEAVNLNGMDLYAFPYATQWALDDMSFDASKWLVDEVGLTFGVAIADSIFTGTVAGFITGILTKPLSLSADTSRPYGTLQKIKTGAAGSLPAVPLNMLTSVIHSLKNQYRKNAAWYMNSTTASILRSHTDTTGRPLFVDPVGDATMPKMLGYPVVECSGMPDVAANSTPIVFGDMKRGYILAEHQTGTRVTPDPYSNKPYVGFYCLRRMAGDVYDSNALKVVKVEV